MTQEVLNTIKRFQEEMETVDDLVHVLLKGHLLIEETLTRILELYLFHPEHLATARLNFNHKVLLCRALCLRKHEMGEWQLISCINSLRNVLAHKLNSPDREKKLRQLKEVFFKEAAGYEKIEQIKKQSDPNIVLAACAACAECAECAECAGFLATFESDSKAYRNLIRSIDEQMNPDMPRFQL